MILPGLLIWMAFSGTVEEWTQRCSPITERVSARPAALASKPFEMFTVVELLDVSFEEVISSSDMVVEGVVRPLRSYFSDDGCSILTDYSIGVTHVQRGVLPQPTRPGNASSVVFTTLGGEVMLGGIRVIHHFENVAPFTDGQRVVLALSGKPGAYRPSKEPYGAFALENGTVKHMLRTAGAPVFPPMDRAAFVAKVQNARQQ